MSKAKTNPNKTNIILMDRDLEVLKFIGKGGLASVSQIHSKFWPETLTQTCYARLMKLQKAGLLKSELSTILDQKGEMVFSLQPAGSKLFSRAIQDRFFTNVTHSEEKQQLLAQDALIKLEKEWAEQGKVIVNWKHERELKGELTRQQKKGIDTSQMEVADAQATVRDDSTGEIYQVEIEVDGEYYGKMLKGKIDRFAASNKPTIWVTTPNRAEMISSRIINHPNIHLLIV
jgi:DNA-binding PadR family transcriptional regulator